jgi:riboflavin synthase
LFTGLIEEMGTVTSLGRSSAGGRLTVRSKFTDLEVGESIAVNGACQTVVRERAGEFSCDLLVETLRVTNLGLLRSGDEVNLERALKAGDPIGGHYVNGHVDGLGVVRSLSKNPFRLEISTATDILTYVVPKGSIAVNGVSLTVGPEPAAGRFEVFIIPHTWEATNLKRLRVGSKVNIEVDILGKYVVNYIKGLRNSV